MTDWIGKAKAQRAVFDKQGAYLTDAQAATVVTAYPEWQAGIEITQKMIDEGRNRYRRGKRLYKTDTPHTTQEGWEPENAPAVWTAINVEHAGTIDDPIPAQSGMEYVYGLYYLDPEDNNVYLCERQGEPAGGKITLYALPHLLVGNYFVLAVIG